MVKGMGINESDLIILRWRSAHVCGLRLRRMYGWGKLPVTQIDVKQHRVIDQLLWNFEKINYLVE